MGLLILTYHHLYSERRERKNFYGVRVVNFRRQLTYLKEQGFISLGVKDILRLKKENFRGLPDKTVMITFDDGDKTFYEAGSILKEMGMKGVLFLTLKNFLEKKIEKEKLLSLSSFVEIGSHAFSHKVIMGKSIEELRRESQICFEFLKREFGEMFIPAFSIPQGIATPREIELLKRFGWEFIFTSSGLLNSEKELTSGVLGRFSIKDFCSKETFLRILKGEYKKNRFLKILEKGFESLRFFWIRFIGPESYFRVYRKFLKVENILRYL